jgi:hypothetical protein
MEGKEENQMYEKARKDLEVLSFALHSLSKVGYCYVSSEEKLQLIEKAIENIADYDIHIIEEEKFLRRVVLR